MIIKFDAEKKVVSSQIVSSILCEILMAEEELDREKEHFWAIGLTAQNYIKYIDLVHLGAINQCPCHPMEIFRRACINGIASMIVAHNHPAGKPEPSEEDRIMTQRLRESGNILGIRVLDHIIIGKDKYYSFSDEGAFLAEPILFKKGGAPII